MSSPVHTSTSSLLNVISGTGSCIKVGPGTLVLTATNTFSGGTLVSAGILQLGDGSSRNGLLAGIVTNNSLLTFANPVPQTHQGHVRGSGALTKSGAGMLTLSATNTYTGTTTIAAGSVAFTGFASISNSANITVQSGAALDVIGRTDQTFWLIGGQTFTGSGVINGKLSALVGSSLNPGDTVGVLTVQSNLTLAGLLVMKLNRTNLQPNDRLVCNGVLNGGGTLWL